MRRDGRKRTKEDKKNGGRRRGGRWRARWPLEKVRTKRFVECFMESFRIVDFLSPIAPGWIYDGRRTSANVRARRCPRYLCPAARDRKYKRILFKFSKSPLFAPTRCRRPESDRDLPSSRDEGRRR